jgi:hypothetical protein
MNPNRFTLSKVSTAALILASVALSGCSSNGTLAVQDPLTSLTPVVQDVPKLTPTATGATATATGATLSSAGGVVSTVGASMAAAQVAGIDNGVMTGLGGAVQQTGNAVNVLGQGIGSSLGQIGQIDVDILALQMASAPLAVQGVGGVVSSAGDAVAAIDNGQMTALSPVTNPAGALLNQTGAGIASLSGNMTDAMANPLVQQITRSGSTMIHMIAIDVEATTQYLGTSTGLGMPVNDLLVGTGLTVKQLGNDITTTFAASPVLASTGAVVSSAGTLVASVGGLVTPSTSGNNSPSTFGNVIGSLSSAPAPGTAPMSISAPLTTLSTPSALSNLVGSLSSISAPGGTTPTSSLGGALSTVAAPITSVLGSLR